jgi:hypothetical protein
MLPNKRGQLNCGTSFVLIVLFFAALATGGLIVNWIGLGRAMSRLSVSSYIEFHQHTNHTFRSLHADRGFWFCGGWDSSCCDLWYPFDLRTTCLSRCSLLCPRNSDCPTHMCPHQPSDQVLVDRESTARMGTNASTMDSIPRHSNSILSAWVCCLHSRRDLSFPSIILTEIGHRSSAQKVCHTRRIWRGLSP